jgi:hypothetical protein
MKSNLIITSQFEKISGTQEVNIYSFDTAFAVLNKLELQNIKILTEIKVSLLNKLLNKQDSFRNEKKQLKERLDSLLVEKKELFNDKKFLDFLEDLKLKINRRYANYTNKNFDLKKLNQLKMQKLEKRIHNLYTHTPATYKDKIVENRLEKEEKPGDFVISFFILQTLFLLIFLLVNFNINVLKIGIIASGIQFMLVMLAEYFGYYEQKLIEDLNTLGSKKLDKEPEVNLANNEDFELISYAISETVSSEISRINVKEKEILKGLDINAFTKKVNMVIEEINKIEKKLKRIDRLLLSESIYKMLKNQLKGLEKDLKTHQSATSNDVDATAFPRKLSLAKTLVINHQDAPSTDFVQDQYNLLREYINGMVIYRANVTKV